MDLYQIIRMIYRIELELLLLVTRNYDHLSKEDLIALLHKRDTTRKLGLVWERDEVEHERALNDDFVMLEIDEKISNGQSPYQNILIEGDNFDALRYLHIAYKGRVKCIYIDPPFNLGRNDFIYNDKYVDEDDAFRHSKWIEFMYRRLMLAKELLSNDGVIFISIGDIEYANLTLLMDQVFPKMRVGTFVWRRRSGANDSKDWFASIDHEYVLCYANKDFSFSGQTKNLASYTNPDGDLRGDWNNDNLVQGKNFKQRPDAFYPVHNPETDTWYPCDPDNTWRFASKHRLQPGKKLRTKPIEQLVEEERVLWPANDNTIRYESEESLVNAIKDGTAPRNLRVYLSLHELREQAKSGQAPAKLIDYIEPLSFWIGKKIGFGKPRYKRFVKDLKRTEKPISTWILPSSIKKQDIEELDLSEVEVLKVGFTSEGTTLLSQMVGNKDFPYPKPISLVKSLIGQATDSESGHIVMDFFAGSGTTGHAVMSLNDDDGGNRTFILVSSTEATEKEPDKNVCRDITARRLRSAIEGYSYRSPRGTVAIEGLGGEFVYMRTTRVPHETLAINIRHDQIWFALQQTYANVVSPFKGGEAFQIIEGDEIGKNIIYISEINQIALDALHILIKDSFKPTVIFSWQPGLIRQVFDDNHIQILKIPDYLIERFGRIDI